MGNGLPLSHIKVLDLTRARAGPTAARHLADWGADVIKIEMPASPEDEGVGGIRHGPDFLNLHRNKRSITLNLKKSRGLELFLEMAREAAVIVENYRPDVKRRLGIAYDKVKSMGREKYLAAQKRPPLTRKQSADRVKTMENHVFDVFRSLSAFIAVMIASISKDLTSI